MNTRVHAKSGLCYILLWIWPVATAFGNGGPFVLKYPGGDPAAKGVLARLDENLKPQRESRLKVIEENLDIRFERQVPGSESAEPPLVMVSAAYKIENPTGEEIEIEFGFPILRGIYTHPYSMFETPAPGAEVRLGKNNLRVDIVSTSAIFSMIRQRARGVIEEHVGRDPKLASLVARTRVAAYVRGHAQGAAEKVTGDDVHLKQAVAEDPLLSPLMSATSDRPDSDREAARQALDEYLSGELKWNERDTRLMVEFASLDFGRLKSNPRDRALFAISPLPIDINSNLGPLGAIGEQKATQFFAKVASCFEPTETDTYESIFKAWGGDVRERSLDMANGKTRPREIAVTPEQMNELTVPFGGAVDPTVYARVDYLDPEAPISTAEKASCQAVLKNLPVIFTFAPMNLLHYKAKFAPRSTETLTVTYRQYAFKDTAEPQSYQLAYVVHPASLWDSFGPIHLKVEVPEGVVFKASVATELSGSKTQRPTFVDRGTDERTIPYTVHKATVTDKTGELFLAVDGDSWNKILGIGSKTALVAPRAE